MAGSFSLAVFPHGRLPTFVGHGILHASIHIADYQSRNHSGRIWSISTVVSGNGNLVLTGL
jgi:hypothetical protein